MDTKDIKIAPKDELYYRIKVTPLKQYGTGYNPLTQDNCKTTTGLSYPDST